jgi:hypothetical protein
MSISSRDDALARRKARIAEYLRQGKTTLEICDLEGLDPANEPRRIRKEVAEPLGLTVVTSGTAPPPQALLDIDRVLRYHLASHLDTLRGKHHYIDVGHMLGMTNKEQLRALRDRGYIHDWTLSQIQRLAVACDMNIHEMLANIMGDGPVDFRKKK